MKKLIASTMAAGLILGSTMTAAAQTDAFREAAPVAESEELGEGGSILVVLLGAAIAAGIVFLIEENEDEDAPTSA